MSARHFLFTTLTCFFSFCLFSQPDTIRRQRGGNVVQYFLGDKPVNQSFLDTILNRDPQAARLFRRSQNLDFTNELLAYPIGFTMGAGIGQLAFRGVFNPVYWAIFGGLTAIAVPFELLARRKEKKAIRIYNKRLRQGVVDVN